MIKIIDWNINRNRKKKDAKDAWRSLLDYDADIALLQEANEPPDDIKKSKIIFDNAPWKTSGKEKRNWRTAVVKLSDHVKIEWIDSKEIGKAGTDDFAVSRLGTLAAAIVRPSNGNPFPPFIVVSMYGLWDKESGSAVESVHLNIDNLSALIKKQTKYSLIVAGDFNILYGYGEYKKKCLKERYKKIFERINALGLIFVGPQSPNGRVADPWPEELPEDSKNVPTYRHHNKEPASRQMDFAFASKSMADQVSVKAINDLENWGPSDHCRLEIKIGGVNE